VTWLIHMCDMTHSYVWHDSFICVTWLIHMCDMTHSYVWQASFICGTWPICLCDVTFSYVWKWLIRWCDRTHSYVGHGAFIEEMWLIHMHDMACSMCVACLSRLHVCVYMCVYVFMCDMTDSYVRHDSITAAYRGAWLSHLSWHDSSTCVTRLIHMWDMTCSYVFHDSVIYMTWLIHMCDMTQIFQHPGGHDSVICVLNEWPKWSAWPYESCKNQFLCFVYTGWRRPIGCLKLQVIFTKVPLIIGLFCRKWPIKIWYLMDLRRPVSICMFCIYFSWWIGSGGSCMSLTRQVFILSMRASSVSIACSRHWNDDAFLRIV